eukprot:g4063.t1
MLRVPARAVRVFRSFSSASPPFSATAPRGFDPQDPTTKPPADYSAFLDFDDKLKKAQGKRNAAEKKKKPRIATDGPPSIGRLGPLKRENRPTLTNSMLKGVVFDLSALLNFFPDGDGDATLKPEIVSDEKWNVGNGARETMLWAESRGLKTAVLPRLALSADVANDLVDFTVNSFQDKLGHTFERVMGNVHEKDSGVLTEALIRECARMELEPKEVMVVTLSPMVVAAAKAKEMHTTALKNGSKNGKAQRQAHFKIEELLHLKDVVEGLNGISYRRDAVVAGSPR